MSTSSSERIASLADRIAQERETLRSFVFAPSVPIFEQAKVGLAVLVDAQEKLTWGEWLPASGIAETSLEHVMHHLRYWGLAGFIGPRGARRYAPSAAGREAVRIWRDAPERVDAYIQSLPPKHAQEHPDWEFYSRFALRFTEAEKRTKIERRLLALGYWLALETLMDRCARGVRLLDAKPALRAKGNAAGRAMALKLGRLELRQVKLIAKLAVTDRRIEREFLDAHPDILTGADADRAIARLGLRTDDLFPEEYAQGALSA